MPYLSAPIQMSAARRWASRPARQSSLTDAARVAVWLLPVIPFVLSALILDALIPGEPYPQLTGISGWIEPAGGER